MENDKKEALKLPYSPTRTGNKKTVLPLGGMTKIRITLVNLKDVVCFSLSYLFLIPKSGPQKLNGSLRVATDCHKLNQVWP